MRIFVKVIGLTSGFKNFTSGEKVVTSGFAKNASWYARSVFKAIEFVSRSEKSTSGSVNAIFAQKTHSNVKIGHFWSNRVILWTTEI